MCAPCPLIAMGSHESYLSRLKFRGFQHYVARTTVAPRVYLHGIYRRRRSYDSGSLARWADGNPAGRAVSDG